jgi:hypothetical protein
MRFGPPAGVTVLAFDDRGVGGSTWSCVGAYRPDAPVSSATIGQSDQQPKEERTCNRQCGMLPVIAARRPRCPAITKAEPRGTKVSATRAEENQSGIFSYYNKQVEIHDSARKHGVADQDIVHAIDYALAIEDAGGPRPLAAYRPGHRRQPA